MLFAGIVISEFTDGPAAAMGLPGVLASGNERVSFVLADTAAEVLAGTAAGAVR